MRNLLLVLASLCVLVGCALLGAQPEQEPARLRLTLLDAENDTNLAGLVRVVPEGGARPVDLPGLYDRLTGLGKNAPGKGWYVVPVAGAGTELPAGVYRVEALSGLETALVSQTVKLTPGRETDVRVRLPFLFRPEKFGLAAGNTHLHLRNLTEAGADAYLRTIPAADRLKVLFLSYLERHKDDASYVSNRYPVGDLKQFDATGVLVNNGEEHRHNFEGFGAGYGHVLFLDIRRLVRPVSLGPGITAAGFDDRPLRAGIDEARGQGGTAVWCHNTFGYEDVPSALSGRLDALNVGDGNPNLNYEEGYYHYLNVGLRLPLSTGTDWFLYDFARVYARVPEPVTVKGWLAALKQGRSQITNGPLLTLTLDGKDAGETVRLAGAGKVTVRASALGRQDFGRLEVVANGKVLRTAPAEPEASRHVAELNFTLPVDESGWVAARVQGGGKSELGGVLYAHTSPVYLEVAGQRRFDAESARTLLRQMEEGREAVRAAGKFSAPGAQARLLALYDEGVRDLTGRLKAARGE